MNVYIYDRKKINFVMKLKYLLFNRHTIHYWNRDQAKKHHGNIISFPKPSLYQRLRKRAQHILNDYYNNVQNESGISPILIDYIKHECMPYFVDYYMYKYSVENLIDNDAVIVNHSIYNSIINNNMSISLLVKIWQVTYGITIIHILLMKILYHTILFRGIKNIEDVVYIRKHEKSDIFDHDIFNHFSKINGYSVTKVYPLTSSLESKHDILYINALNNSHIICFKAYIYILTKCYMDVILMLKYNIYTFIYNKFPKDVFYMSILIQMKSKLYFGILADKTRYNLLYKYKYCDQKLAIIIDGVNYNGNIIYHDCFYANIGYYQDLYTLNGVNINGGKCDEITFVGSIYSNINYNNKFISDDLLILRKKYHSVILIASAQFNSTNNKYVYYEDNYLSNFLYKLRNIAIKTTNTLYILKEKKGEFDNEEIYNYPSNVYVVRTEDPKHMKVNHFLSLLTISNILVTLAPNSTVIPQAIVSNIITICYNQYKIKTPWGKYKYMDADINNIQSCIEYWLCNIDKSEKTINIIKDELMLNVPFYELLSSNIKNNIEV